MTPHIASSLLRIAVVAAVAAGTPARGSAQDGGPGTGGLAHIAQLQRTQVSPYRVLVIGAHPDDEDNDLIAVLSRGWGVETAYLSLTRGEGGQNLIGSELGAALGVVRAGELVAARRVDGGQQFFTRAFDFGFTKTVEETFRFWPRDSVLKDVVRIIRRFQPHVIVSVFSGTPRDGHGQHQAAGQLALDGFHAAGDASRFPELGRDEQLRAWTVSKLYRDYGVQGGILLDAGRLDPATGLSLHQLGRRSRSQHRSQDMGALEDPGPATVRIALEALAPGVQAAPDDSLFAGILAAPDRDDATHLAQEQIARAGLVLDAFVPDAEVTPGERVALTLVGWNGGNRPLRLSFTSIPRDGWSVVADPDRCLGRDTLVTAGMRWQCQVTIAVTHDARPDQPYYLSDAMDGMLYRWGGSPEHWGAPFDRPLQVRAAARLADGAPIGKTLEVTARRLDQGLGEIRTPVTVVPPVLVELSPGRMLWPRGVRTRSFEVSVEQATRDTLEAVIGLEVPAGWRVDPARTIRLMRKGERRTLRFHVTRPATLADGEVTIRATATVGNVRHQLGARRIAYPHIREQLILHPAVAAVHVAAVRFPPARRMGYLRGAADGIPEALASAGVAFRLLQPSDLEGAALDSLDVIVIGPRAYETSDALRRAHPRLVRFAERGGRLIVQYQQYQFVEGRFAPFPLTVARPHDRVTDESAPVRWLPGAEAVRTTPNRLTDDDFAGWVQERGLYFAATWDPAWTPLLELSEPGESPKRGGLLIARLGRGIVVYTGIAFFRQLPAAVPGAWRLFANLLAL